MSKEEVGNSKNQEMAEEEEGEGTPTPISKDREMPEEEEEGEVVEAVVVAEMIVTKKDCYMLN